VPGEHLFEDGVVIYEGMRFTAAADGHYEVRFTVSVPAMPVTLRLQLVFVDNTGRSFVLTLPPISIVPERSFEGNYLGSSYQIHHLGYSRLLAPSCTNLCNCTILRQGTARFGSWPEGATNFERLHR
jgi:hypothetical protein